MTPNARPAVAALLGAALVAGVVWLAASSAPTAQPAKPSCPSCPDGKCPAPVQPQPPAPERPKPRPPRRWGPCSPSVEGKVRGCLCSPQCACGCQSGGECECPGAEPAAPIMGGPVAPDGTEVQCEVPVNLRMRNIGSRIDGAGMCVTTSATVAARWSGLKEWDGLRDYCAGFRGGSMPTQHLRQLKEYADKKGLPPAPWAQYTGNDPAPFLDAVLKSGRIACVSWMNGGHWLNLVHLDDKVACIMDNNGNPENLQWMARQKMLAEVSRPYAWVGAWTAPGAPPPPRGAVRARTTYPVPLRPLATLSPLPRRTWPRIENGVLPFSAKVEGEYSLHGRPASLEEVQAAFGSGQEPYLSVIGDDQTRKKVLADVDAAPALAGVKGKYAIGCFAPTDWQVKDGHVTGGTQVYVQDREGAVLLRLEGYSGPDALAAALGRRRVPDPNYDPSKDPRGQPDPLAIPGLELSSLTAAEQRAGGLSALIALAGGIGLFATRRKP